MASTNKTSLGFNDWVGTDKPERSDFVADNRLADTLFTSKADKPGTSANGKLLKWAMNQLAPATAGADYWSTASTVFNADGAGYIKFPNGFTIQWASVVANLSGNVNFFPISFSSTFAVVATSVVAGAYGVAITEITKSSFKLYGPTEFWTNYIALGVI